MLLFSLGMTMRRDGTSSIIWCPFSR